MSGAGQSGPSPVVRVNDHVFPNPWGVDLAQRTSVLKIVSERLSLVRYVFLVQIEDGIATATQRASLEYADAVLIGRPFVTMVYGGEHEGVKTCVEKLGAELKDTMAMCGVHSLKEISRDCVTMFEE